MAKISLLSVKVYQILYHKSCDSYRSFIYIKINLLKTTVTVKNTTDPRAQSQERQRNVWSRSTDRQSNVYVFPERLLRGAGGEVAGSTAHSRLGCLEPTSVRHFGTFIVFFVDEGRGGSECSSCRIKHRV